MKIKNLSSVGIIEGQRKAGGRRQSGETPSDKTDSKRDQVQLSDTAGWISELQSEARRTGGVREDVVQEVQAQLAAGTLEDSVDWDRMLDRLLGDL